MPRTDRASDLVYVRLRDEILTWELRPGTPLSEVELADRLGVSRTPLRAALARLALEGLIDTSQGRTGIVPNVSAVSIRELFEVREALEVHAARLAARRRDPSTFSSLAAEFVESGRLLDDVGTDEYYDVIRRFDEAIDEAIDNRSLRTSLDTARAHLARARRLAAANPDRMRRAADEHAAICRAIAEGDEALAAAATTTHLRASLAVILATLTSLAQESGSA